MKSPVANREEMKHVVLDKGLIAYKCVETGGIFIPAGSYWSWLDQQPERLPHREPMAGIAPPIIDSQHAKICPETGTVMMRCAVGHGFDFSIDRSLKGSIWLDAGEWEALKQRNFHDELHLIFSAPWQQAVRNEEIYAERRERMKSQLGEDLLSQLDDLKASLRDHAARDLALSYLLHED